MSPRRPPLFCFVGPSDVGKTTLVAKVIGCLTRRGVVVGALKHASHRFDMDREGKDTWHFRQAGAHAVAIASPTERALIASTAAPLTLDELAATLPAGIDMIIVEGWKSEGAPKVEVRRGDMAPLVDMEGLVAIATDRPDEVDGDVPAFDLDDVAGLCDLLEQLAAR